jgi:hypothetical protein
MSAAEWEALLGFPFIANYIAFSGREGPQKDIDLLMVVDYAGLDAQAVEDDSGGAVTLPTEFSGTVKERLLSDGRTRVTVTLHTTNALTYVLDFTDFAFGDTLFGATPSEVAKGAEPSLGDCLFKVTYIVPRAPGEPMEDLVQVVFDPVKGTELSFVAFFADAFGTFRAASGFEEGTLGHASTQQTGLIGAAIQNGFQGALADAFPAEWINLQAMGAE